MDPARRAEAWRLYQQPGSSLVRVADELCLMAVCALPLSLLTTGAGGHCKRSQGRTARPENDNDR